MPQSLGLCGHLRSSQDNHPTCLNCSNCFRGKTCGFCESWSSATWPKFEKRRSYHTKMAKKKESSARKQTAFKKRPMKTPEFVERDSGESVVREVIDSSEYRLNYQEGASGSSEESCQLNLVSRSSLGLTPGTTKLTHRQEDKKFVTGLGLSQIRNNELN